MTLKNRLETLENIVKKHLEQSEGIQNSLLTQGNDIRWIKRAIFFLFGTPVLTAVIQHMFLK